MVFSPEIAFSIEIFDYLVGLCRQNKVEIGLLAIDDLALYPYQLQASKSLYLEINCLSLKTLVISLYIGSQYGGMASRRPCKFDGPTKKFKLIILCPFDLPISTPQAKVSGVKVRPTSVA